jgi:hypothetical protein
MAAPNTVKIFEPGLKGLKSNLLIKMNKYSKPVIGKLSAATKANMDPN